MRKLLQPCVVMLAIFAAPIAGHAASGNLSTRWKALHRAIAVDRISTETILAMELNYSGTVNDREVNHLIWRVADPRSTDTKLWATRLLSDDHVLSSPEQAVALHVVLRNGLSKLPFERILLTPEAQNVLNTICSVDGTNPPDYEVVAHIDTMFLAGLGDEDLSTSAIKQLHDHLAATYVDNRPSRAVKGYILALAIYLDQTGDIDFCRSIWAKSVPKYRAGLLHVLRDILPSSQLGVVASEITSDVIHSAQGRYNDRVLQEVVAMLERQCCHPAVAQLIDYDFFNSLGVLGKYNFRLKFAYLKNIHAPSYDTPAGHSRWADLILENAKREGLLLQHFSNDDDSRVR